MFLYALLAYTSLFFSCQTEPVPSQDPFETVVDRLIQKAEEEQSAINSIIKKSGNDYTIRQIEKIDNSTLGLYLGMETNFSNKEKQFSDVVVTCSDSGEFTVCSGSGMSQKVCVGKAIKKCFDNGECAEVCEQEILIIPPGIK